MNNMRAIEPASRKNRQTESGLTKAQLNRKYMISRHRKLERAKIEEQNAEIAARLTE